MSNFTLNKLKLESLEWIKYSDTISYVPLDKNNMTYLVRIAPREIIPYHAHESPELEIEILHFMDNGFEAIVEGKKIISETILIHHKQKYEIRNTSDEELFIISQFFPEWISGTEHIKKYELPQKII